MLRLLKTTNQAKNILFNKCYRQVGTLQFQQNKFFSDSSDNNTTKTTSSPTSEADESSKLGGFAKAFNEFEQIGTKTDEPPAETVSFKNLLRNSKFVDLGDPQGKFVLGKIVHTVDNDLYIDFGWKFNCVCTRPEKNGDLYVRGSKVKLRINELEMSTRFLGEEKDLTILEADCKLIGLVSSPKSNKGSRGNR